MLNLFYVVAVCFLRSEAELMIWFDATNPDIVAHHKAAWGPGDKIPAGVNSVGYPFNPNTKPVYDSETVSDKVTRIKEVKSFQISGNTPVESVGGCLDDIKNNIPIIVQEIEAHYQDKSDASGEAIPVEIVCMTALVKSLAPVTEPSEIDRPTEPEPVDSDKIIAAQDEADGVTAFLGLAPLLRDALKMILADDISAVADQDVRKRVASDLLTAAQSIEAMPEYESFKAQGNQGDGEAAK